MQYLNDTLDIEVSAREWDGAARLQYYLTDRYRFKAVTLEQTPCIFMAPIGELDALGAIKKHIAKVREIEPLPVVLELSGITAWRRKSLIEARIPFVASDYQIYLPFLGILLTEKYTRQEPQKETLMPSSQLLFFYYLYRNEPELYITGLAEELNLSVMQVSRAVKQLAALRLISSRKDGVRIVVSGTTSRSDLFEKAKPYLLNPVRKRIFAKAGTLPDALPLSGISALSELSMLSPPQVKAYAYYGVASEITGTDTLIDDSTQVEVEIWQYNPILLSDKNDIADKLSLITSLQSIDDERVEQAAEDVLSELWKG